MQSINIRKFKEILGSKTEESCVLDVREPAEFRGEHLQNTENVPLSEILKHKKINQKADTIYLLCKSGKRSAEALKILTANTSQNFVCVEGGLDAWKEAKLPIEKQKTKVWALERQVRFTAGLLVVLGILLSQTLSPVFIWLSGFVGLGLIFAAVTDTCGMAMMLTKMPWNR